MGVWSAEDPVRNATGKQERFERTSKMITEAVRDGEITPEQGAQSMSRARADRDR